MSLRTVAIAAALAAIALPSQAAISVTNSGFSYSQSFDSLATTGTSNAFSLEGWTLSTATYRAGNGSSNTGAFYSFGSDGATDRALGGVGSSGLASGYFAVAFKNDSGSTLSKVSLGFDGEQWRNGGSSTANPGLAQAMVLQYGFGDTIGAVSWIAPGGSFNWSSPVFGTTAAAAVNGNTTGKVAGVGGDLGLNWAANQTLWVRWIEVNDPNNDHALAIDNFTITAVPEPSSYAMLLAGLGVVGLLARRRSNTRR
ncbi:MAG TPA: PEP-CTERM sorting domain-containing protein [Roseateles sp.]|nr:PEP-CTERM sorting domain-containing protein [Roseateles sp.]